MNKREKEQMKKVFETLADVFDTLESQADSDIDHFEDEEEERECVPVQYSARKVNEAMNKLERMIWGAV